MCFYVTPVCVERIHGKVHAIRPAYIVLAGLGAGNILLVIIAIVIICSYPLNVGKAQDKNGYSGGGGGAYVGDGYGNDGDEDRYGGGGGAGYLGGGGYADNVEEMEMTNKQRDDEHDYADDRYMDTDQQQQAPRNSDYYNENEMNHKRLTAVSSFDDELPARVEENPYFNNAEIEASAAF